LVEVFKENDIPAKKIGTVGGNSLRIHDLVDVPLSELDRAYCESLRETMETVS